MRVFHSLIALAFLLAWLTGESKRLIVLHASLGYLMAALLALRLVYGLLGPRSVRWGPVIRRLRDVPDLLRGLGSKRVLDIAFWRRLEAALMALVTAALLALTIPMVLSGHAASEKWGAWLFGGRWVASLHEGTAYAYLVLVIAHLTILALMSLLHWRNAASPMLTGRMTGRGPDLLRSDRKPLGIALAVSAVLMLIWLIQTLR